MIDFFSIHHIALTITDYDRSLAWYADIFDFERLYPDEELKNPVFVANGPVIIALFKAVSDHPTAKPEQSDNLIVRHFALRVGEKSFVAVQSKLDAEGILYRFADHSAQHPPRHSMYFDDPDGHEIEVTKEV